MRTIIIIAPSKDNESMIKRKPTLVSTPLLPAALGARKLVGERRERTAQG
jgi:hypothetical protein